MKSIIFLSLVSLTIIFSASINSSSQSKNESQDTTKVEYWKKFTHEAEQRAKLNEAKAIMAMKQKLICEKQNQELNKLIEEQRKTIEELKSKVK